MKIGINGMGRIGRLALRSAMGGIYRPEADPRAQNRLDIVHINEVKGGIAATAHLLEFDSIHGRWNTSIGVEDGHAIIVDNQRIEFSERADPGEVAWGDLGCDIVLECTGKFLQPNRLQAYFERGVKRVIVAAPVKDAACFPIRSSVTSAWWCWTSCTSGTWPRIWCSRGSKRCERRSARSCGWWQ